MLVTIEEKIAFSQQAAAAAAAKVEEQSQQRKALEAELEVEDAKHQQKIAQDTRGSQACKSLLLYSENIKFKMTHNPSIRLTLLYYHSPSPCFVYAFVTSSRALQRLLLSPGSTLDCEQLDFHRCGIRDVSLLHNHIGAQILSGKVVCVSRVPW